MTGNANEPENDGRSDIANRLHSVAIHLLRRARRDDPLTGISPARLSALSVVGFGGPVAVSELAAAEQVSVPTISRIVQALESDGLVRREVDRDDARVARISATNEGMRVLWEGRRRRTVQLGQILAQLSTRELKAVDDAVTALENMLGGPH